MLILPLFSEKEQCKGARAGMRADYRTDVCYKFNGHAEPLLEHIGKRLCIRQTIAVRDIYALIIFKRRIAEPVRKRFERRFAAANFRYAYKMTLIVNMKNRLNSEKTARKGGS